MKITKPICGIVKSTVLTFRICKMLILMLEFSPASFFTISFVFNFTLVRFKATDTALLVSSSVLLPMSLHNVKGLELFISTRAISFSTNLYISQYLYLSLRDQNYLSNLMDFASRVTYEKKTELLETLIVLLFITDIIIYLFGGR